MKTCQTCLYMGTHEKCEGCLRSDADYAEYRKTGQFPTDFRYLNYQEGNWLLRTYEFEKSGKRNIVIGYQGEAEVNVKETPAETSKHLHCVAEQCGYSVGNLKQNTLWEKEAGLSLIIHNSAGCFRIYWNTTDKNEPNKLLYIDRLNPETGQFVSRSWPLFTEKVAEQMRKNEQETEA